MSLPPQDNLENYRTMPRGSELRTSDFQSPLDLQNSNFGSGRRIMPNLSSQRSPKDLSALDDNEFI